MEIIRRGLAAATCTMVLASGSAAFAGEKYQLWDDDSWVSIGAGLRAQYIYDPDASNKNDFSLNSARIYANGQFTKIIGFTYNTEIDHNIDDDSDISRIRTLDAILRVEFSPEFNVWGGRMLPPSDRANLDGPYYLGTWEYPVASAYPGIFAGRDNGGAVWGDISKFKYELGGFQGCTGDSNACHNDEANGPLYAGRLQYDFWDKEAGYYTSSDYYGEKELLSVAVVGQFQKDASIDAAGRTGDFSGFNVDAIMQKKVWNNDVFTLEGAFYNFNTVKDNVNGLADGDSWFLLTSYLINQKIGIGKFQPVFRYQEFDADQGADRSEISVGTNYIIKGHDLRLSALYSHGNLDGEGEDDRFVSGIQLQW